MEVTIHFDLTTKPMTSKIRLHPDTKEVQILRLIAESGFTAVVEHGKETEHPEDLILSFKPDYREKE